MTTFDVFLDELEKISSAWIKQRAQRIMREGGAKPSTAYALATLQAYATKAPLPKRMKTKKAPYGTPLGRLEAKLKYPKPPSEYQKTASAEKTLEVNLLSSLRRIKPTGKGRKLLRATGTIGAYVRDLLK